MERGKCTETVEIMVRHPCIGKPDDGHQIHYCICGYEWREGEAPMRNGGNVKHVRSGNE